MTPGVITFEFLAIYTLPCHTYVLFMSIKVFFIFEKLIQKCSMFYIKYF